MRIVRPLRFPLSRFLPSATLLTLSVAPAVHASKITFPADIGKSVVDYGARGDDQVDDTKAIRDALNDGREAGHAPDYYFPRPKFLYFPAGTYIVSDTLTWIGCAVTFQGQGTGATVIRLADRTSGFADTAQPRAVFKTMGGNYSFRQNFHDLTVNTGSGNDGAIGIDYITNNVGAMENVEIVSGDGGGFVGLDMSRQWPGPCLVKNVTIDGFRYGIRVRHSEYGPTFEDISLRNQRAAGIHNAGNVLAIHNLVSTNSVPAIVNTLSYGYVILTGAMLRGGGSGVSAIESDGLLYARNVAAEGYRSAIRHKSSVVAGLTVGEYISDSVRTQFPGPKRSLGLRIEHTPEFHDDNTAHWMRDTLRWYGDTQRLQQWFNSGKSTIYFPAGTYLAGTVIRVPATVKRIIGFNSVVNTFEGGGGLVFSVEENSPDPLIIERFGYGVTVHHKSGRTVAIKHGGFHYEDFPGAGKVFLEDVGADNLTFDYGQRVWMRQLNTEGKDLHITNNGSILWILGVKTEGKGTVIKTVNGGATELLGTLLYPCQSFVSTDGPAFISTESSVSFMYRVSSYVQAGGYVVQVEETRNGITRKLASDGNALVMPLYAGFDSTRLAAQTAPGQIAAAPTRPPAAMSLLMPVSPGTRAPGTACWDIRGRVVTTVGGRIHTGIIIRHDQTHHGH